jgi:hypothetical protein
MAVQDLLFSKIFPPKEMLCYGGREVKTIAVTQEILHRYTNYEQHQIPFGKPLSLKEEIS